MSCNEDQKINKLDRLENRIDSVGVPGSGDNIENYNNMEGVQLPSITIPNNAYNEVPVSAEHDQKNDSEVYNDSSEDSGLRHRININTTDNDGSLNDNEKVNSVVCVSSKDEQPNRSPPTYLQIYSNDCKDNEVLEQSTKVLIPEKERLIAIVKPTNSETTSNIVVIQKDDLVSSGRPPNDTFKNMPSNETELLSGEQKSIHDNPQDDNNQEPTIMSVDFDAILPHVGEMGRYQICLYLLMCIPATLPAAFLAFNQVFLSATPTHWCRESHLYDYNTTHGNITLRDMLKMSVPRKDLGPGRERILAYENCFQYNISFNTVYPENEPWLWPNKPNTSWPVMYCADGWEYDRSEYENSLVTEMDLVCKDQWWPSTSTALFYVGSLFGNVLFGVIADRYGRRTSFFLLLTIEVFLSVMTCFSPNYVVFTVIRTLNGFTFPALFQIPFILCLEVMGPAYRTFAGMMICLFFAVALMLLAGLAYIFNSWFSLAIVTSVPFVALFSYWFFVPESPRWLLSYGRLDEAEKIIQSMAKWNGKEIGPNFVHQFVAQQQKENPRKVSGNNDNEMIAEEDESAKKRQRKTGCCSCVNPKKPSMLTLLLYYPVARRNFTLITFNWLANALVYNGLSFYSANLNVSSHLGFFISSAVEIPSYFLGWYFMDRWGRRWILFATMMTGGVSCICCMFVPLDANPWITVTLAMIGKFQIAASFAVIYVYAGELMPTVVRSEAMGISSFVAGIGLLIFPYINSLGNYSHVLPLVIMGSLSVMGGITALFLPETLWTHLPNTLDESEAFGSHFNICSCPHKESPDAEENDEENGTLKPHIPNPCPVHGTSELYLTTGATTTQNTFCSMSKCNSKEEAGDSLDKTASDKKVSGNVNITINQLNEKEASQQKPLQPNGKISLV